MKAMRVFLFYDQVNKVNDRVTLYHICGGISEAYNSFYPVNQWMAKEGNTLRPGLYPKNLLQCGIKHGMIGGVARSNCSELECIYGSKECIEFILG